MANYNLTSQQIKDSFQQLAQVSGSIEVGVSGYAVLDGTGSRVNTLHVTASNATSASYAPNTGVTSIIAGTNITVDQSTGDVTINSSGGGGSADTGSLLVTSSAVDDTITFTKGDGSQYTNTITLVSESLQTSDVFITVKNTSGADIGKGLAVHATGVTGENVNIKLADSSVSGDMPAIGITRDAISNNSSGVVILSGKVKGLNTASDGLVAGAAVYVNGAGVLTSTKPTGSDLIQNIGICGKVDATDGQIIVMGSGRSNDLPNIASGYVWAGNSDSVPTAVLSSSLLVDNATNAVSASHALTASIVTDPNVAYINKNNTFTGTQSFDNISVSGTGSFAYIQAVTGSAKTIGDAFIILNNNTPTQVYAGVKVQDSGSTAATASLQWDGTNDQWFFEKEVSGTGEFGVVMGGPEYSDIASPAYLTNNRIAKGNGSHHLNDSVITDDGTTVSVAGGLTSSGSSLNLFTDTATANGQTVRALEFSDNTSTRGTAYDSNYIGSMNYTALGDKTDKALTMWKGTSTLSTYGFVYNAGNNLGLYMNNISGSVGESSIITELGGGTVTNRLRGDKIDLQPRDEFRVVATGLSTIEIGKDSVSSFKLVTDQTNALQLTGSLDVTGDLAISGISNVSASIAAAENVAAFPYIGNAEITGSLASSGSSVNLFQDSPTSNGQIAKSLEFSENTSIRGNTYDSNYIGAMNYTAFADKTDKALTMWKGKSNLSEYGFIYNSGNTMGMYMRNVSGSTGDLSLYTDHGGSGDANFRIAADNIELDPKGSFKMDGTSAFTSIEIGRSSITSFKLVTDEVNAIQITGSLDITKDIVSNGIHNSGSFITTGSTIGNLTALAITSNTASIDFRDGDYYTLQLVSGSDTHLEVNPSGTKPGQTAVLKVQQPDPGSGTLSYASNFRFPGGTVPTATDGTGAEDILTFVNFGFNETYVTMTNDLK